jgi:adenylate kinase family enzyme
LIFYGFETLKINNMKTPKEIIIETLQGEGLMYAYRDFADDIKDEHIEKIADKIVKNLNIPAVSNNEVAVAFGSWLRTQRADIFYGYPTTQKLFEMYKKATDYLRIKIIKYMKTKEEFLQEAYGYKFEEEDFLNPAIVITLNAMEKYAQEVVNNLDKADVMISLPSQKEIDEQIDKYAFRVPYDGSNNFYDEVALKHYKAGIEWLISRIQGNGV